MLHHVIYASTALINFDTTSLYHLLFHARKANHARQITGILLYHNNSFLQMIEGPEETLQPLFERISSDVRHRPQIINNWAIPRRQYDSHMMSFVDPSPPAMLPDGYIPYSTILQDDRFLRGIDRQVFNRFHAGEWSRQD